MTAFPRESGLDSTRAFLSEGYDFVSRRCEELDTDVFETRLLLRKALCVRGEDAARMFYHPDRFTRRGAMPPTTLRLLQDKGSVQWLDGHAHRHRKHMFLSLLTPKAVDDLIATTAEVWGKELRAWRALDAVVLHKAVRRVLCRAVCRWAGVPLANEWELGRRTNELSSMIDAAGGVGPKTWTALFLRERAESWARGVIDDIRSSKRKPPPHSAAAVIAAHRDEDGALLDKKAAAVELINVLRPTVAVGRFITFAALALHEHPEQRRALEAGDDDAVERFTQEVRRFYPFFPVVGGLARAAFEWRGQTIAEGTWVLLDLYGTNHDERVWREPHTFDPDRFRQWNGSAFNFIAQGAGEHANTHRCPGERLTIELVKAAVRQLVSGMRYDVPPQDLSVDLSQMPAIPRSRFVISDVRTPGP